MTCYFNFLTTIYIYIYIKVKLQKFLTTLKLEHHVSSFLDVRVIHETPLNLWPRKHKLISKKHKHKTKTNWTHFFRSPQRPLRGRFTSISTFIHIYFPNLIVQFGNRSTPSNFPILELKNFPFFAKKYSKRRLCTWILKNLVEK